MEDLLQETRLTVIPITPDGDKISRAYAGSAQVASGRVKLPESAP